MVRLALYTGKSNDCVNSPMGHTAAVGEVREFQKKNWRCRWKRAPRVVAVVDRLLWKPCQVDELGVFCPIHCWNQRSPI